MSWFDILKLECEICASDNYGPFDHYEIDSGNPNATPTARTSSLNSSRNGSNS